MATAKPNLVDHMLDLGKLMAYKLHSIGIERTSAQVLQHYSDFLAQNGKRSRPRTIISMVLADMVDENLLRGLAHELTCNDYRIYRDARDTVKPRYRGRRQSKRGKRYWRH